MPAKKKKAAAVETAPEAKPASGEVPAAGEQTDAMNLINSALEEIAAIKERRDGLAGLDAKVAKQKAKLQALTEEYEAAEAKIAQAEAAIIAKYPKARGMLGTVKAKPGRKAGTKRGEGAGTRKKSGGKTLDLEQAGQVLAAMPAEFELGAFNKKAREMHPGFTAKGAMKLLKDKVKKLGGKGMGMQYKRI